MSTNNTEPATAARQWVWRCTDASIEAGQISVFAVLETLLAVAVYWYLVWRFHWPWMMFISMLAAPMLLLRSEQSVKLGLRWLKVYWHADEDNFTLIQKAIIIGGTAIINGLLCYWLAQQWFPGHVGWDLFWRAAGLGAVALAVAVAFGGGGGGAGAGAGAVAGAGAGAVAGAVALAGVAALASARAVVGVGVVVWPFFAAGLLVRTLLIRIFATLRHPIAGLRQLPQNWRSSLWVIDPCHLPELLPQAGEVELQLTLAGLWSGYRNGSASSKAIVLIFTPFYYFPAMLYRWSLKASAWLWFPLVLVLTPPLYQQNPKATRKMLAIIPAWHWHYVGLASLVLVWMLSPWAFFAQLAHKLSPPVADLASSLPTAPHFGLRFLLACTAAFLTLLLVYRSKNFKASHGKVLESPNEFRQLDKEDEKEFMDEAKGIDRIKTWLIAAILFWGYASVLALTHHLYPQRLCA